MVVDRLSKGALLGSGALFYQTCERADGRFAAVGAIEGRWDANTEQILLDLGYSEKDCEGFVKTQIVEQGAVIPHLSWAGG